MNFDLEPEHVAFQEMCRRFAATEIAPHAKRWSEEEMFPSELFIKMGEIGLMGMLVPAEYGGSAAGMVPYVAAMEEIGGTDQSVGAAWNAHTTIGSLPLLTLGTEVQKQRWLRPLAEGKGIGAFGLTESDAGSDAAGIRTSAARADGGWRINGTKMFISNAGTDISIGVSLLARLATEDVEGHPRYAAFFVPEGTPGYEKAPKLRKIGWHALDTRELRFVDCWVPEDHLLGDEGQGLRDFLSILDAGRISFAALSLSLAAAALRLARDYALERRQFGRPISSFQAIQHKLATMSTDVDAARWLVYHAAWLFDMGRPYSEAAAKAKLFASEVANRAASSAVQVHGGYGFMRDQDISRFYADAKILEIGEGTNEIQRTIIARHMGC